MNPEHTIGYALWIAMHATVGSLRRCNSSLAQFGADTPEEGAVLRCLEPALWVARGVGPGGESFWACDDCCELFKAAAPLEMQVAPHAAAVRRYRCSVIGLAENVIDQDLFFANVRSAARELLRALPPCPARASADCARCEWLVDPQDESYDTARVAVCRLTKVMSDLEPEEFGSWPLSRAEELARRSLEVN